MSKQNVPDIERLTQELADFDKEGGRSYKIYAAGAVIGAAALVGDLISDGNLDDLGIVGAIVTGVSGLYIAGKRMARNEYVRGIEVQKHIDTHKGALPIFEPKYDEGTLAHVMEQDYTRGVLTNDWDSAYGKAMASWCFAISESGQFGMIRPFALTLEHVLNHNMTEEGTAAVARLLNTYYPMDTSAQQNPKLFQGAEATWENYIEAYRGDTEVAKGVRALWNDSPKHPHDEPIPDYLTLTLPKL